MSRDTLSITARIEVMDAILVKIGWLDRESQTRILLAVATFLDLPITRKWPVGDERNE